MAPDASGISSMDDFEQNSIKMIAESFDMGNSTYSKEIRETSRLLKLSTILSRKYIQMEKTSLLIQKISKTI
jgi:hypothetical protein